MAHKVISLKYRPQNFDEITGQKHIVLSLKGAIKRGAIGTAYLFAGPRGVGKTTTARIFAKSLNCITGPTIYPCQECQSCLEITQSRSVDVVEIDGASNRGIDEIRNLREGVRYAPLHSRYKAYIIDEVHMLTPEAFNALLKTLEEPPPSVVFILATTNPTKLPGTILSRCQRFIFKRLSISEIKGRLNYVAEKEEIKITNNALHYLALRADGSIRDGESILEQLTSFVEGEITEDDVFKLVGFLGNDFYYNLLNKIVAKDLAQTLSIINKGIEEGADPLEIYRGLTNYLRKILLTKVGLSQEFLESTDEELKILKEIGLSINEATDMLDICLRYEEMIKRSVNTRIAIELLLSQLAVDSLWTNTKQKDNHISSPEDIKSLLISSLENRSPRLTGIIHKTTIKKEKKNVIIQTDNEFSKTELLNNHKMLEDVLKKLLGEDISLDIQIPTKEENNIIQTIKTLFDGEEVR